MTDPKTRMSVLPLYMQLKAAGEAQWKKEKRSALIIRNRISALNTFMKFTRSKDSDAIGQEMGANFDNDLIRFCDYMRKQGLVSRTIEDRCGFLVQWRKIASDLSLTDTLPEEFPDALLQAIERAGYSFNALARATGIGSQAIGDWAHGRRRPAREVAQQIPKLETALYLPAGTLSKRLHFVIERHQVTRDGRAQKDALTTYGRRLRRQYQSSARLNYLKSPHPNVRIEWRKLIDHKVDEFRTRASNRDCWRIKPEKKTGSKGKWASVHPAGRIAAADAAWNYLSRYLSWLCLPHEHGGAGLDEGRISTLAWVLNHEQLFKCLQWIRMRSDGILHLGQVQILNYVCMLLRPETGWLWLNPQVIHSFHSTDLPFPIDLTTISPATLKEVWQRECEKVWELYKTRASQIEFSKNLQKGREPTEPIKDILAAKRPLTEVMRMLTVLVRNPPPVTSLKAKAVWLRDVLLLSFLTAVPLRAQHFSTMTFYADGSGNLYKVENEWHYRAPSEEHKNGAQCDIRLPGYVGEALDNYLRDGRHHQCYADECDYVFLPAKSGCKTTTDRTGTELPTRPPMWPTEAISNRVRLITRSLRNGLPGFGPHAFRHIVATDYLKRYPGAYQLVAQLLNDRLATVIKEYGHVAPQDGLELHYESVELELRLAMGKDEVTA